MKKLLLLALALSLPLSQVVRADNNNDQKKKRKRQAESQAVQQAHQTARPARPTTQAVRQPVRQTAQRAQQSVASTRRTRSVARVARVSDPNRQPTRSEVNRDGQNRQRPQALNQVNNRNRNVDRGRTNSQAGVQRNRGNRTFNRNSFSVARSRVVRGRHDRGWWRNHYNTTFVLFGGGYYYYDTGYWYPAYGYSPIYNTYAYSEPIYGYNNLAPGQVLENVQVALRDQGYYRGAIDGLIGAETRSALARYQQDQGLVVTSAVDEPTLVTLGLA